MKNTKLDKGITLIALIITIVVLLILAVVAINAVTGEGILGHAKEAQLEYEIGQEKESIILAVNEAYLAGLGRMTQENLINALNKSFVAGKYSIESSNESFIITINESGRKYTINKDGIVEGPTGGTESGGTGADKTLGKATVGIKVEKNSTIDGEAYSSTNPIIPAGFRAINTTTSSWDAVSGPEVDNGLVIQDESGNEFVWVPVPEDISTTECVLGIESREPDVITSDAVSSNLERTGLPAGSTSDDFKTELVSMYSKMAQSINQYDGFYVGRYETSRQGNTPQSRKSTYVSGSGELIETAYNSSVENDWYGLYALNKRYSTSSVKGSMMWGIQYDKMMYWMGAAADKELSGYKRYNTTRTCGTAPEDVIKNVYDIYGNSCEWTLVACGTSWRNAKGGNYNMSRKPSFDWAYVEANGNSGDYGSRLALYVEM